MNVLVTDGENRSALATTRSLGRKGCTVFVSGAKSGNIAASSKYCRKAFKTPDPMQEGNSYALAIAEIVAREEIDVIFPMTEQSVYCLNKARELLEEKAILACAPTDIMEAVSDKCRLFHLAEKLGVLIPRTIYVEGADDFLQKSHCIQGFPVVVKPAFSKILEGERIISTGVMYASDQDELSRLYESKPALRYPSMIQEMIIGDGTGLFTLFDKDRHLALFSHRRLLEKPPSGGVSVLSESIPLDDEMVESSRKLLSEVGWKGVAMVEFKRDNRDGRAKLMEINGRFWGSVQLAVSSGVDFPALCLDYYLGKKPTSLLADYHAGQKMKWSLGILDHLIIRLKRRDSFQSLPPPPPTLWQVMGELVNFCDEHTSSDVYDIEDTKPFYNEVKSYFGNILRLKI
jgi:predicted ATP-grasp superfamily ATP-dependent carboligase